jgi:beta-1,4-mannosyl-glycoprotein beta-1,4-N-acetylglucosaminyltransferase
MVYDCFPFFNELDVLDIRLHELDAHIDKFVLVEATHTFTGREKKLYYEENKLRFIKFQSKIIHLVYDFGKKGIAANPWDNEKTQRNFLSEGIDLKKDDLLLLSDVDEIPDMQRLRKLFIHPITLNHSRFDLFLNYKSSKRQQGCQIWPMSACQQLTMQEIRDKHATNLIINNGWHFSFLGSIENSNYKLRSFSHSFELRHCSTDPEVINMRLRQGKSPYTDDLGIYKFVQIDETFPTYLRENIIKYQHLVKT